MASEELEFFDPEYWLSSPPLENPDELRRTLIYWLSKDKCPKQFLQFVARLLDPDDRSTVFKLETSWRNGGNPKQKAQNEDIFWQIERIMSALKSDLKKITVGTIRKKADEMGLSLILNDADCEMDDKTIRKYRASVLERWKGDQELREEFTQSRNEN